MIEDPSELGPDRRFQDFTEVAFRELLRSLKKRGYVFAAYGEAGSPPHVLWRHDVDFSMHRAARLAEIEADESAFATYFVNPHCAFYNLLEADIAAQTRRIRAAGHELGLHFDAGFYGKETWDRSALEAALQRERTLLEEMLGSPVNAVSWHNPDQSNLLNVQDDVVGGMINAYAARLRHDYAYCSDSNGFWRFEPMPAVIDAGHPRLHLLTHPEWWTPEPMSPSRRIDRAIMGRAKATRGDYDASLARAGRKNVT